MVMASADERSGPSAIFTSPARWGFEFAPPHPATLSPERNNPPQMRQVKTIPLAEVSGVTQLIQILAAAWGVSIVFDLISIGAKSGGLYYVIGFLAAIVSVAINIIFRSRASSGIGQVGGGEIAVFGIGCIFLPWIFLGVQALRIRQHSKLMRQQQVPDPADLQRAQHELDNAQAQWQQRVKDFEEAERSRVAEADLWFPVVPSPGCHVICAFGGQPFSWAVSLATYGGSLLGSGQRVFVCDLSQRLTVDPLWKLARTNGYAVLPDVPPSEIATLPPVFGLSWDQLTGVLTEVSHSTQRDQSTANRERQEDRAVLREVTGCLTGSVVSIARLRLALQVVQGSNVDIGDAISNDEHDRLTSLYNDVQRHHGGVMERITRIERMIRPLTTFDNNDGISTTGTAKQDCQLQIVGVDKWGDELDNELLADVTFHLLMDSARQGAIDADALVILGADRISRKAVELLGTYAERANLQVVLYFEHLREDAVDLIGTGGAAAAFFALPNHKEAQEAVAFIGSEYKWVTSQQTRAFSESVTRSFGTTESENWSEGQTTGVSGSHRTTTYGGALAEMMNEAIGRSEEYSRTEQRVHEAVIEPNVLMGLPVTAMICVEIRPNGQRIAANVDCHPAINYLPRVSKRPREIPGQRDGVLPPVG